MSAMPHEPFRTEKETWRKALRWVKKEWRKRWPEAHGHPSHLAGKILAEAEEKFELGTFGVEGFCGQEWGDFREGVSYLNIGETYDMTITHQAFQNFGGYRNTFRLESWGDAYERFERRMDRKNGRRHR